MAINFNTSPYFDDFDPKNNFYRVLFKPGYAIQARELNQLQSILQNQVSSVGKHLFKKNSIIIPGSILLKERADILRIVGVSDPSTLVGKTITNKNYDDYLDDTEFDTAGTITAVVLSAEVLEDTNATTTSALYVKYFKTGSQTTYGNTVAFGNNVKLYTVEATRTEFASYNGTTTDSASTVGKVAALSEGVFFTKDVFVDASTQFVIVELDNKTVTNCSIGLDIVESIVTSNDDSTLLDNSNGYPNQYAPGADRYKISLKLTKKTLSNSFDENKFIKMMDIENNAIVYVNNKTQYAELMKTLAQRTYDANGNFIVSGLQTTVADVSSDANYLNVNLSRGKCYVGGYDFERTADTIITVEKPRSAQFEKSMPLARQSVENIPYMYIAGATGLRAMPEPHSVVQFLDATPETSGAAVIGHGVFRDAYYYTGNPSSPIYIFRFDSINLSGGVTVPSIGGLRPINSAANAGLHVLHELSLDDVRGTFAAGNGVGNANVSTTNTSIKGATGVVYYVTPDSKKIYVRKTTTNLVPSASSITSSAGGIANCTTEFVTNYSANYRPTITVDGEVIKSVDKLTSTTISKQTFNPLNTSNNLAPLSSPSIYSATKSAENYFGFVDGQFVDLTDTSKWTLTIGTTTGTLQPVGGATGFVGKKMDVYAAVVTTDTTAATRTSKSSAEATITIPVSNQAWTMLGHQDVIKIDKIVEGKKLGIASISYNSGTVTVTCTDNHNLTTGQTVVIRDVYSSGSTGAAVYVQGLQYNSTVQDEFTTLPSYNGQFTVASTTGATGFTYTLSGGNPGTATLSKAIVALPPNINTDTDVTSRYKLYTGGSFNFIGNGQIKINNIAYVPKGQLQVRYYYTTLSSNETRRYVDAYSYANTYTTPWGSSFSGSYAIAKISDAQNNNSDASNSYNPRNMLDYRTRTSNGFAVNQLYCLNNTHEVLARRINFSGATGIVNQYLVNKTYNNGVQIKQVITGHVSGDTIIVTGATGATVSDAPAYIGVDSSFKVASSGQTLDLPRGPVSYEYTKFKPRDLILYVDRYQDQLTLKQQDVTGVVSTVRADDPGFELGMSSRDPFKLPLARIHLPPYTVTPSDVNVVQFENPVYQMIDIHLLKNRIDRAQAIAQRSINIAQNAIIEARSPKDSWVESFDDIGNQDTESDDFACKVYENGYVAPTTANTRIDLTLAKDPTTNNYYDSTTFVQTTSFATLPYTEAPAFSNKQASTSNNINPYNTTEWEGKLELEPYIYNQLDMTQFEILTEISNLYVAEDRRGSGANKCDKRHRMAFNWKTSTGRTGRVDTDVHIIEKRYPEPLRSKIESTYSKTLEYDVIQRCIGKSLSAPVVANANTKQPVCTVRDYLLQGDWYQGKSRSEVGTYYGWWGQIDS